METDKRSLQFDKEKLFTHCVNHEDCSHFFGLDFEVKNKTLFEKMTESFITDYESFYDPLIELCSSQDPETALEKLWPLIMISRRGENLPVCPLNHMMRINPDLSVECVCISGSNCSSDDEDDEFLAIILWIFAAVIIILLLVLFVRTILKYTKLFRNGLIWSMPPMITPTQKINNFIDIPYNRKKKNLLILPGRNNQHLHPHSRAHQQQSINQRRF